jgi:hypothetical protein
MTSVSQFLDHSSLAVTTVYLELLRVAPTLASISVTPGSVSVAVGGTVQFTATGHTATPAPWT